MTRQLSEYASNPSVPSLLNTLADKSTGHELYKETMTKLGHYLGQLISEKYSDSNQELYLACTVEDADFLAKGILDEVAQANAFHNIRMACFWNERFMAFDEDLASAAPIKRRYLEPSTERKQTLVIVKSIISGACVVKTNLKNLINEYDPEKILIVSPVILLGAEKRLEDEFSASISSRFHYIYYATDDHKDDQGNVVPGIGGNVYQRLGFKDQEEKNKSVPNIVKNRRKIFSAA